MSLRLKLLLLGLATLVLPWAGFRYAREMEGALREGEQGALQAVARTLAASLQGRTDLLYRDASTQEPPQPGRYDLQPVVLVSRPYTDGYGDEWPRDRTSWRYFSRDAQHRFGVLTGVYERMLFVLVDVDDAHVVFDAPGADPLDESAMGDRLWLSYQDQDGHEHQVFLSASGPGSLTGRRIESAEFGEHRAVEEPRITGAWQLRPGGWRAELAIPLSMLGERFGLLVDDRAERGAAPVSYGSSRPDDLHAIGRLIVASPELATYLRQFSEPGLELTAVTPAGRLLARVDALDQASPLTSPPGLLARLYRRFVDRSGGRRVLSASDPVYDAEHQRVIARLELRQSDSRWLRLRDRALTRMLNLNLAVTVAAVLLTFAFSARLAMRLARLKAASESALTRSGLDTRFPETQARDELGDLARAFAQLLARLGDYTGYLRGLAGKLAHEIRTPLTIVRSSLENLESEGLPPGARPYLERAREGTERLNGILASMGAATRVEEAIGSAERKALDLSPLLSSALEGYRGAFPEHHWEGDIAPVSLWILGAGDLIMQLLDKLVENAVDFAPRGGRIRIAARKADGDVLIEVENEGPTLSTAVQARLFESLWQARRPACGDARPHFGLGLYVARLIAEFHHGSVTAGNLPDGSGVRFTVRLPGTLS